MKFKVIAVGKLKEKAFEAKCSEFVKWLSPYAKTGIAELPDGNSPEKDKTALLRALDHEKDALVIALSEEGKLLGSEEFSRVLEAENRRVVFVIGGPDGLAEEVKQRAAEIWSLSPLTFTHEIARLLLLEQLYRAVSISRGGKYHRK